MIIYQLTNCTQTMQAAKIITDNDGNKVNDNDKGNSNRNIAKLIILVVKKKRKKKKEGTLLRNIFFLVTSWCYIFNLCVNHYGPKCKRSICK